ncbi:MAG: serine/threonine protein kinase [Planctomycetes bacterium]|nr:serine/threonine protein kinase [Planctomycetota bacterium]
MTCRICSASFDEPEDAAGAWVGVCPDCQEKLSGHEKEGTGGRTTVMRPVARLRGPKKGSSHLVWRQSESGRLDRLEDVGALDVPGGSTHDADGRTGESTGAKAPAVGKVFGSYEILAEVSRGSFGVVYRARQKGLERQVALKVLLAGVHASEEAVARFQREARAVARLKHPNIVPIYDIGMQDGHHYFAMEFVEGHSLSDFMVHQKISTPQALKLVEILADAIESAHQEGVIHRDIKPSNIIVDPKGLPHITDFGLAKQVDIDTQYTQSGTTLGTPAYMPPEQARGEVDKIDPRSDVYALGAVLYEMLAGRPPFAGRSLLEVVVAVINEPVKPPRQINPNIHRDVQTIVMKCLEKDPRNRYASAAELRDDLRRFRSGEAIQARPVGLVRRGLRLVQRQSYFFGAVAIVLVAVTISYFRVRESTQDKERYRAQAEEAQQGKEELEKKLEEKEQDLKKDSKPSWVRFWYFPTTPDDKLTPEERALFDQGFVHPGGNDRRIAQHLYRNYLAQRGHTTEKMLTPDGILESPGTKSFPGDIKAEIHFELAGDLGSQVIRAGLQSRDESIPYLLEIGKGRVALHAPEALHGVADAPGALSKMIVKAEKSIPELQKGTYTLRIEQEGLHLTFVVEPPAPAKPVSLAIWDMGLSHWKFKNTQLTFREPPPGLAILSANVQWKTAPKTMDKILQAMQYFYDGEHNRAEAEFKAYLENKNEAGGAQQNLDDALKDAQAYYFLGLIRELFTQTPKDLYYQQALDTLKRCEDTPEKRELAGRLYVRMALRAAKSIAKWDPVAAQDWEAVKTWLNRVAELKDDLNKIKDSHRGIGEPFGWELQDLIEKLVKPLENPTLWAANANAAQMQAENALSVFQLMGLSPGSFQMDIDADQLAKIFARPNPDGSDALLRALHKAYPSDRMLSAFNHRIAVHAERGELEDALALTRYTVESITPVDKQAAGSFEGTVVTLMETCVAAPRWDLAGILLDLVPQASQPKLVTAMGARLAQPETAQRLAEEENLADLFLLLKQASRIADQDPTNKLRMDAGKGVYGFGASLVAVQRYQMLKELYKAWTSPGLANNFAAAVEALAASEDPRAEEDAMDLLRFCSGFAPDHKDVRQAALNLAGRNARPDGDLFKVLAVYEAYPAPEILKHVETVLKKLLEAEDYHKAKDFYQHARIVFGLQARKAFPLIVGALLGMEDSARTVALGALRTGVREGLLKGKNGPLEARGWDLEFGDLLLAVGTSDEDAQRAATIYDALAKGDDPALRARAALRLGAIWCFQGTQSPLTAWSVLEKDEADFPEKAEAKLAAACLNRTMELPQIEAERQKPGTAPRLFSRAEWEMIKALRLLNQNKDQAALQALEAAHLQARVQREWPEGLKRIFVGPAEPKKPKLPKTPAAPK